jgi:hypothetical protein
MPRKSLRLTGLSPGSLMTIPPQISSFPW